MARIAARHRAAGDDHPHLYSEDPREMLRHLRRYRAETLLADATGHDLDDALTIRLGLWWEGEEDELHFLDAAEKARRNRRAIGAILGIRNGQGLVDRRNRLRARLHPTTLRAPKPQPAGPSATTPQPRPVDPQVAWVATHRAAIAAIAATLVAHRDLADDDAAESLTDVAQDLREGHWTPGSVTVISWAVAEMSVIPDVAALPADHNLARALRAWDALYPSYPRRSS